MTMKNLVISFSFSVLITICSSTWSTSPPPFKVAMALASLFSSILSENTPVAQSQISSLYPTEVNLPLSHLGPEFLSSNPDLIHSIEPDWNLLHLAAALGNPIICQSLLQAGALANLSDSDGWTPLHLAAASGNLQTCQFLLDHGADPSCQNHQGWTPLRVAADSNHVGICQILMDQNAEKFEADLSWVNALSPCLDPVFARVQSQPETPQSSNLAAKELIKSLEESLQAMRKGNEELERETRELLNAPEVESVICGICYIRRRDCLLLPCSHMSFCTPCIEVLEETGSRTCPMCRGEIIQRVTLRFPSAHKGH